MTTPLPVHGVDISRYQSGMDWPAAARAGVGWAYHKVTEAMSYPATYIKLYADRRAAAEKAGIAWGGYHFARPKWGQGKAEAAYFLKHLAFRAGDLRPMLDLEDTGGLSRTDLTTWVGDFVAEVKRSTGELPIIYCSRQIPLNSTHGCLLWVPRYSDSNTSPFPLPAPWKKYAVWQFSNGVYGLPDSVAGLGHVDLNTFGPGYGLKDLLTAGGKTKPAPVKETNVQIKATKLTPNTAKMIKSAADEVGYREGANNNTKFAKLAGHANNQPWCATFLEGISDSIGMRDLIPEGQSMASVDLLFQSFQKIKRVSEYPAVGAFFMLGQSGAGTTAFGRTVDLYHVGLVYAYDANNIYTIEGNTNDDGSSNGNGVYARVRARRGSTVFAYAYPDYKEGVLSADPAWKNRAPKDAAPTKPNPTKPTKPAPAKKPTRKLKMAVLPGQFSDGDPATRTDFQTVFDRDYDIIYGTEVGPGSNSDPILKEEAKAAGYHIAFFPRYDTWVGVKSTLVKKGTWKTGADHAIDRSSMHKPTPPGRWGDKALVWAQCEIEKLGVMSFAAVHPLTHGGAGPALKAKTDDEHAEVCAAFIKKHGKGSALAFIGGDWNLQDRTQDLTQGKWKGVSCWDELKEWDNTGHGNIDAILRSVGDARVLRWTDAESLDDKRLPLATDHFLTEATVEIEEL